MYVCVFARARAPGLVHGEEQRAAGNVRLRARVPCACACALAVVYVRARALYYGVLSRVVLCRCLSSSCLSLLSFSPG